MSADTNKMTWDLDSIFPGGSSSSQFAEFRKAIVTDLANLEKTFDSLPESLDDSTMDIWAGFLVSTQDIVERISHADSFAGCLGAQDVSDDKALIIEDEISNIIADWRKIVTGIEKYSVKFSDDAWKKLMDNKKVQGAKFYWNETRDKARLKMDPDKERLVLELSVNGYHAWNRLYSKMAGDLQAEFAEDGKTEVLSMGQLANKFSSPNRAVRKAAFNKLEETWGHVDGIASMILNSQAGYRLSLYKNRGWDSPAFEPLLMGRLKKETLDAMWKAVARGGKEMKKYIDAKKKLLGINNFRWYDQFAPVGTSSKKIDYSDACDLVVKHLGGFSPELGSFARMAIDKRWIEAEDRSGKAAGGFCTGLDVIKESRIFMTFSGNYDELMTLAHELGHAYHSHVLRNHDFLSREYPMNLAETASTFNELLVTDAALAETTDEPEKLVLLDQKIQQGFGMFCNLYARYLFDMSFYEERKSGSVSKDRLNELMIEAQKQAFGETLANDGYHKLFWASKLHFFETEMPFYNFPYTFGFLFAGGIYDRAKKEGAGFADKYKALLADTGSMTTEDVAQTHLGIDLTTGEFWNNAVDRVLVDIEPFCQLAKKLAK
ncbi:MAG: M3 family oligoendopeptidase [candidate division Zixibacteria bacterium]|nr:M3 family oligoendopeptidase [candidate division Zixibacteria bacterium]